MKMEFEPSCSGSNAPAINQYAIMPLGVMPQLIGLELPCIPIWFVGVYFTPVKKLELILYLIFHIKWMTKYQCLYFLQVFNPHSLHRTIALIWDLAFIVLCLGHCNNLQTETLNLVSWITSHLSKGQLWPWHSSEWVAQQLAVHPSLSSKLFHKLYQQGSLHPDTCLLWPPLTFTRCPMTTSDIPFCSKLFCLALSLTV